MTLPKGSLRTVRGKHYTRPRLGEGRRPSIPIALADVDAAQKRADRIRTVADRLVEAGRWFDVEQLARAMGAAQDERAVRVIEIAAERLAATGPGLGQGDETFEGFAARWTSGALHRSYPDHVPVKQAAGDIGILTKYVNPLIGHIPVKAFTLEHADSVMRVLPSTIGGARRRHVAQVIHRVIALAVFPAKLLPVSPIPKGWLPKLGKGKALTYLYPDEDRALLEAWNVPIAYRMLYGFLTREGMRLSEVLALTWADIDLARGAVNLDENKTDDPRAWALDASVVEALRWWKSTGWSPFGPFKSISARHMADKLREDLRAADVDREALFKLTDKRRPLRVHDLRATFVTLSLANGRTESWVQDRTGHRSTLMIAKYRRAARTVAELGLGTLAPLAEVIPEMRGGSKVGQQESVAATRDAPIAPRKTSAVAPPGLEPGRPSGPEILKPQRAGSTPAKHGKTRGLRRGSHVPASPDPHGDPHPTQAPTWRGLADSFDGFVALELGVRPARSRKG